MSIAWRRDIPQIDGAAGQKLWLRRRGLSRALEDRKTEEAEAAPASLALSNMRGLVILVVLTFHSVLAYLGSLGAGPFPFDQSPYKWRAFPIVDSQRWFGFDIFCAWQDVYLMSLMFFLSALFAWPSLKRKGSRKYLNDRLLRLGLPFLFGIAVITPLALYPVYRVTAVDPGLVAYARHLLALPFWPNGPLWFLWLLIAFAAMSAGLRHFAPRSVELLGALSASAAARPRQYFAGFALAAILAYVPLALLFTPWDWTEHGPFALQLCRPLLYAVYYFAGLGIGACGIERGLLAAQGPVARRWSLWLTAAIVSLLLWMGLTALTMRDPTSLALQVGGDVSFALASVSGCFFVLAGCLWFGVVRSRVLASLSANAFGMYVVHYVFVVWFQYALLGAALPAVAKAMMVFGATLAFSWAATAALRVTPFGSRLIGEQPLTSLAGASSPQRVLS